jgi:hypothetical protein
MPDRLNLDDNSLFPVQTFFNAIGDASFIRVMNSLTNGVGYSINECDCSFPGDLDPCEETFQGVRFSLFEQSAVISNQELVGYIKKVCKDFVEMYPEEEKKISDILDRLE